MKTTNRILLTLVVLLAVGSPAFAQKCLSNTTFAAAVTGGPNASNTVRLTTVAANSVSSAAICSTADALAVGHWIYAADSGEAMQVTAISGTTVSVIRGVGGTSVAAHASGAVVVFGSSQAFKTGDTQTQENLGGACTASTMPYVPLVYAISGDFVLCRSSVLKATNPRVLVGNSLTLTP